MLKNKKTTTSKTTTPKTPKKVIKTRSYGDVGKVTQGAGDHLLTRYYASEDLKVAQASLAMYRVSISCAKLEITEKKRTGRSTRVRGRK